MHHVAANLGEEAAIAAVVALHRERYERFDVLVNNAAIGFGAAAGEHDTKQIDLQLDVNLRAIVLFYREALELLRVAGPSTDGLRSSIWRRLPASRRLPWLSVYSATKAGVIAYTQAMNRELNDDGIRSVALCPGWVDTHMTEFVKD